MAIEITEAVQLDARAISQVIIAALRTTNTEDYSRDVIERVEKSFSPSAVSDFIGKRIVFVALQGQTVVGTASLDDGQVVRSVFVDPQAHRQGIGRQLMSTVEQRATDLGIMSLLPSSITAERFYQKLGYSAVRETYHGEERTIVMERPLIDADSV